MELDLPLSLSGVHEKCLAERLAYGAGCLESGPASNTGISALHTQTLYGLLCNIFPKAFLQKSNFRSHESSEW